MVKAGNRCLSGTAGSDERCLIRAKIMGIPQRIPFPKPNHTAAMPATAFTTENCFESAAFCAWWDAAHSYQLDHALGYVLGVPDDGWALDCLLESYLQGLSPVAAVNAAIDGYDPTPQTPYDWFH